MLPKTGNCSNEIISSRKISLKNNMKVMRNNCLDAFVFVFTTNSVFERNNQQSNNHIEYRICSNIH